MELLLEQYKLLGKIRPYLIIKTSSRNWGFLAVDQRMQFPFCCYDDCNDEIVMEIIFHRSDPSSRNENAFRHNYTHTVFGAHNWITFPHLGISTGARVYEVRASKSGISPSNTHIVRYQM